MKELTQQRRMLFQTISLRKSNVPKYVKIDTSILIDFFTDNNKGPTKGEEFKNIKNNYKTVWSRYFNMNKKIFKGTKDYIFNNSILTDGIGCSVLFRHKLAKSNNFVTEENNEETNKKKEARKLFLKTENTEEKIPYIDDMSDEEFESLKYKKIVCADPGKKNMIYMMDDEGNKVNYTAMQRDNETRNVGRRRIMRKNKNREGIVQKENELSLCLSTTSRVDKFKEYIRTKYETDIQTKKFYEEEINRKLRWRQKVYTQKSEDKFLNKIGTTFGGLAIPQSNYLNDNNEIKSKILICIGDWSNKNIIKGLAPSMGIGLKRLIAKKYDVKLIWEYNTSKLCCNCWGKLEKMTINGNKRFRLLGCSNCVKNKLENKTISSKNTKHPEDSNKLMLKNYKLYNRDKNSCLNMISIVKNMIYTKNHTRLKEFSPIKLKENLLLPLVSYNGKEKNNTSIDVTAV
jgi:hypothetical protein